MKETYTIKVGNLNKLDSVVKRINKKAEAKGLKGVTVTVLEDTKRIQKAVLISNEVDPWLDTTVKVPVVDVEVEGNLPDVKGYSYVAAIEKTENGNLILGGIGYDLSRYRNSELSCDHCKTKRNRKKTIIVKTPEGKLIQIGRSCVKDFLGVNFEDELKALESLIVYLRTDSEDGEYFGKSPYHGYNIESFLSYTAASIRTRGWVSTTVGHEQSITPTKDIVFNALSSHRKDSLVVEKEDVEVAKKALEWVLSITPDSDFTHTLLTIAKNGFVTWNTGGYAAAIIKVYEVHMNKTVSKNNQIDFSKSEFVGEIGSRIQAKVKVLSKKIVDSYYGSSTVITFVTPDGNILTTFASGSISDVEREEELTIKGTVKNHNIFRDSKQTILNRVVEVS